MENKWYYFNLYFLLLTLQRHKTGDTNQAQDYFNRDHTEKGFEVYQYSDKELTSGPRTVLL